MNLKIRSKTYKIGAKDEGLPLKRAIGFLSISVFGIFANVLNLELHFGVNFIFGSIFTMIVIRYYGVTLGVICAIIVSIYTVKLWGHPYAIIIFSIEALFVGYFAHKNKRSNYLTIDLAYWLFVGGPLVWIFYGRFLDLPIDSTLLIFAKQTVNGLTNVAIAALIVLLLPLRKILGGNKTASRELFSLAFITNTVLPIFTLGPAILISMIANQNEFEREKRSLIDVSARHAITVASFIENYAFRNPSNDGNVHNVIQLLSVLEKASGLEDVVYKVIPKDILAVSAFEGYTKHADDNFVFPTDENLSAVAQWREALVLHEIELGKNQPFKLVMGWPVIDAVRELQSRNSKEFILIGFVLSISLLTSSLISGAVVNIVREMTLAAEQLATEPERRSKKFANTKIWEFGLLADWINKMIQHLNSRSMEQERIANDLKQLIDTANAPIFGIDTQGRINEWNQKIGRMTGFSKDEVVGKDLVADYITEAYKDLVKLALNKALAGEQTENIEFPLLTKSGGRVEVLANPTIRRDAKGIIVGVVAVGQDTTEIKISQAQVIHASKLATLGEMATSIAHEINQPLNVIRMAADNCRIRLGNPEYGVDYFRGKLERIESQTARAASIIDHMQMFGRKTSEEASELDPRVVVDNTLMLMGEQLRQSGIKVIRIFPSECGQVLGHIIQLEQVLLNLLTNSRDAIFMNPSEISEIRIEVEQSDNRILITISDSGGGVDDQIIERIFEPFFTTKAIGKGTGLGLSVSYGIVTDMGGMIVARNTNGGAEFEISLPVLEVRS